MFRKVTLIPALCALALSGAALGQPVTPPAESKPVARSEVPVQARMAMHVSALVAENLKPLVPDDRQRGVLFLRMLMLAKQEALAHSCEAFTLDQKRHADVMLRAAGEVFRAQGQDQDAQAAQAVLNRMLRDYNTLLGGELAQFAYDPEGYCKAGEDLYQALSEYAEENSPLALKLAE